MEKAIWKAALRATLPVLMGYLAIGVGFGWMMDAMGYHAGWALAMSLAVYAGSAQYLAVGLLGAGTPLGQAAFLTLVLNVRHLVYGLSMLERFRDMGWRKPYMIFSLTDETYALLTSVRVPEGLPPTRFYFAISLLDHLYWLAGTLLGSAAGTLLPLNTQGIEFGMTALFLVIAVEQWQSSTRHHAALLGGGAALLGLLLAGAEHMLLPALGLIVIGLWALNLREERRSRREEETTC